jgi:hypothetical protein
MQFGNWTVIELTQKNGRTAYLCRCACGTERVVLENNLMRGISTNCGCIRKDKVGALNRSHGAGAARLAGSRAASVWLDMHKRCRAKRGKNLRDYSGRGIRVCARWSGRDGFKNFLSDMGEPPHGMSIGRKDNNAIYSPENCEWETPVQQQNNTRSNVFGWLNGERMTAAQIAKRVGKDRSVIARQIKLGLYGQN